MVGCPLENHQVLRRGRQTYLWFMKYSILVWENICSDSKKYLGLAYDYVYLYEFYFSNSDNHVFFTFYAQIHASTSERPCIMVAKPSLSPLSL